MHSQHTARLVAALQLKALLPLKQEGPGVSLVST